ncbi:MAG: hypothetical protein AAF623_12525 [Planctomycetota bacterium]
MGIFIGTDEAGYGPNLGPLTITGTRWRVPDIACDLYDELGDAVCQTKAGSGIWIADSKSVYKPSGSIKALEENVLATIGFCFGTLPESWSQLIGILSPSLKTSDWQQQPWFNGNDPCIPICAKLNRIKEKLDRIKTVALKTEIRLDEVECVCLFPSQFNRAVSQDGNKATVLSRETLGIIRRLMGQHVTEETRIECDKHGGRSKYNALIQQWITENFVLIQAEGLEESRYQFEENGNSVTMRFGARGESFLPTALASMVSKYVREIWMSMWNDYWQIQIPGIRPTKGYPVDAKRFRSQIIAKCDELEIGESLFWRSR